jgi:hypothetical protein
MEVSALANMKLAGPPKKWSLYSLIKLSHAKRY